MNPVTVVMDGIRIPQGIDAEKVKGLSAKLDLVVEAARKAQSSFDKKRSSVADGLLAVARECASRDEFNVAYSLTQARFLARTGSKAMPKVYTQTASDIRRMYDQSVDLSTKDPATGEMLTYSKLKQVASKAKQHATAKLREQMDASKPQYLKDFEGIVALVSSLAVNKKTETYAPTQPVIEQATGLMKELYTSWIEENPIVAEADEEEHEESGEARQRAPREARA